MTERQRMVAWLVVWVFLGWVAVVAWGAMGRVGYVWWQRSVCAGCAGFLFSGAFRRFYRLGRYDAAMTAVRRLALFDKAKGDR